MGGYQATLSKPLGGCLLKLRVDPGRIYHVQDPGLYFLPGARAKGYPKEMRREELWDDGRTLGAPPLQFSWGAHGFDSAYEGNLLGCSWTHKRQFCIADASRITVVEFVITDAAEAAGWSVVEGRLQCPVATGASPQEVAAQDAILAGFRAEDVLAIQEKMQFTSEIGLIEALNEAKAYWEPLNWIDLILHVD